MRWIWMVTLGALMAPGVASACGNEVRLSKSDEVKAIVKAEAYLEKRKYRRALGTLMTAYGRGPMTARARHASNDKALAKRARRVGALVGVRTGGKLSLAFWNQPIEKPKAIARQLRWSRDRLKAAHEARPDDPARAGHYAEALAAIGETDAALKILEPLAKADLIVDAETWKVLADLRAAKGDAAGKDTAMTRCEATAIDKALCRPTG